MKIYFAAVGVDLIENFNHATEEVEKNILFSFYDMTQYAKFNFRKRSWREITDNYYEPLLEE